MSLKKRKKEEFIDDGRTVADMNVDGMPWYTKENKNKAQEAVTLTKEENAAFLGGVLKAALLVAAVFAIAGFLFILFCTNIWFR